MAARRNGGYKVEVEPDPATWTASEEKLFVEIMVREVQKGNRSTTTFSRKGWKHIEQEFRERTHKRYNNSQFRNKFNQLRTRFNDFTRLLKTPGFIWDPVLGSVSASEDIWDSYIKANKKAKRFRKKGCPMYNEMAFIYGGDQIPEYKDVVPLAQYPSCNDDKLDLEDASTNATPSALPSDSDEDKDYPLPSRRRQRSPTPISRVRVKRVDMGEASKDCMDVIKDRTPGTSGLGPSPISNKLEVCTAVYDPFTITNCVKCLESIEGVSGGTYLKAINMFKDRDWREMFLAMSGERRVDWLSSL